MEAQSTLYSILAQYGPWAVLAVGVGAVALTFLALGVFLYSKLIGESKGDEHRSGAAHAEHPHH